MFGQTLLDPKSILMARVQARVGEFLGIKEKLMRATINPSLTLQAEKFLVAQRVLESDLDNLKPSIDRVKQGLYSFGDVARVTTFAGSLELHMRAVKSFLRAAGELPVLPSIFSPKMVLAGVGALALIGYMVLRKKGG